ncbi:MAG: ornithine carbamoyltransferase [Chloroflexi bacterium]|nr:ornithine carbamoyltransferase [Chloroflexota bacterium]
MQAKDFLSVDQLAPEELIGLITLALELKRNPRSMAHALAGRAIALVFEKPSLRTRVSFEMAAQQLGGHCLYLSPAEVGLGQRESTADIGRVLSRYVDALVARTFFHRDVEILAKSCPVPVINGLSDRSHPCQILADLLTIQERFGKLDGLNLAYVGDGNNVARSLMEASPLARFHLRVASPVGYEPDLSGVAASDTFVQVVHDPFEAVAGAHVIYTDAWFSMGQEAEREARAAVFPPYQVTAALVRHARPDAIVLHCLPAHRGEEITDEVIEGPQSAVFDQAENRLHAQKALLIDLMAPESVG